MQRYLGIDAIFASPESCVLLQKVKRLALMDASVLIEGESGSGKEVLARALHAESMRASKPWVDVSCAALPEHLVESELFGYEKGAFSGADSRKEGLFESAHTGTLFLDEIGELAPKLQAKLLRVLDGGSYFRLGGTKKVQVDVRVITATNRELREAVSKGEFRKDLYYRLAQLRLQAIPLRDRTADIIPIAQLFLSQQRRPFSLSEGAKAALVQYCWPGNVRELRNAVVSAAAMAPTDQIQVGDLPEDLQPTGGSRGQRGMAEIFVLPPKSAASGQSQSAGLLEQLERTTILDVLHQASGHHERAAKLLGISPKTLGRKLKLYGENDCERNVSAFSV